MTRSDFDEESWAENMASRLDFGLERQKQLTEFWGRRKNVWTRSQAWHLDPHRHFIVWILKAPVMCTRVDYLLVCPHEPLECKDTKGSKFLQRIRHCPSSSIVLRTRNRSNDHKMISVSVRVSLGSDQRK